MWSTSDDETAPFLFLQFEIRLCPALQKKPTLPAPHFDAVLGVSKSKDPFSPPYIPGLFLGELKDEEEGQEYVLLVSSTPSLTG